jgi:hypothetical protein
MLCRSFLITCFLALAIVQAASADTLVLYCFECALSDGSGYSGGATPDNYNAQIDGLVWGLGATPKTYWIAPCHFGCSGPVSIPSLSFQTGDLDGSSPQGWSFGSGGSFALTGSIFELTPDGTLGGPVLPNTILLAGSFLSAVQSSIGGCPGFCYPTVFSGELEALANPEALALLGLPDTEYVGHLNLGGSIINPEGFFAFAPPDPFNNGPTDIVQIRLDPVPEPSSLTLLAAVFVTFGGLLVRRRRVVVTWHRPSAAASTPVPPPAIHVASCALVVWDSLSKQQRGERQQPQQANESFHLSPVSLLLHTQFGWRSIAASARSTTPLITAPRMAFHEGISTPSGIPRATNTARMPSRIDTVIASHPNVPRVVAIAGSFTSLSDRWGVDN